jgi:AcrR family transcriptional regulator
MARPSQEAKIRDAALRCFAERGYDGTRVTHIADRANVSGGALYSHFESKEALARTLFQMHLERCSHELRLIADGEGSVEDRLTGCIRLTLDLYRQEPHAFTFSLLRQHSFMPDLPKNFDYPINVVARLIEEGQREGALVDDDSKLLAAIFLGCVLRPLIVSQLSTRGSLDLLRDESHDALIASRAYAAIERGAT